MYYDINQERLVSDAEMTRRGLPLDDAAELARLGFHVLTIERPEYDAQPEGIEPDGPPAPDPENPLAFVQHMRVYHLLERKKDAKKAAATAKRWEYETGGISLPDGTRILTAVEDQNRIATAIQGMRDKGLTEVDFKAATGWVTLGLEQLVVIAGLITAHVQACFSRERALHEAIDACADLDALNAIDLDAGWPGVPTPDDEGPAAAVEDAEGAA